MKFAHIADTHIRNLKYHFEYRAVFQQLYEELRKESVDYIIHCGDIAHTKTQISPEFVEMCSDFLRNLADIAPTYVILGNHDGNLRNASRQDALSPIVSALNHSNLYLLKDSGEVNLDEKFTINVLSVFDRDNWNVPSDPGRINIALYHGAVSGVKTDTGWTMESGEDDINIFNNFDYGFLGDIHKTNQAVDKKGKIRYPGSTVQQNHGETNDKGFLLWNIVSKDEFTCQHKAIENPKPFITIKLTPKGRLPNKLNLVEGSRIRLVSENNLPLDAVRKAVDAAKLRFNPESVTYLSRAAGTRNDIEEYAKQFKQEDLRDLAVQEGLIKEYLEDFQPSEETLKNVFEKNKKYNAIAEQTDDIYRNVNWRLKKLEWDNLFNYGEQNCIDFENLSGVVGIFGKNFSGKSSIIDSLLYTLFNSTSKNNRKNLNLINQNEDSCRGYVEIDVGLRTYCVERKSEKYTKRLKGKETQEAKTDVEFTVVDNSTGETESLNGITRIETDKNIRKIFGAMEDFLTTSMVSQTDSLSYLNEGSTKRKEILAKFLDLEFFDSKFRLVKEDTADLKGAIKNLSGRDYEAEIDDARTELARTEAELSVKERSLTSQEEEHLQLSSEISSIEEEIHSIPEELSDIKNVKSNLAKCHNSIKDITLQNKEKLEKLKDERLFLEKIDNFISSFDIESYNKKKQVLEEYNSRLEKINTDIIEYEQKKKISDKKIDFLKTIPCSHDVRERCGFVRDARSALDGLNHVLMTVNQLTLGKQTLTKKVDELNPQQVEQYIQKYEMILNKKTTHRGFIAELELGIEKNKTKLLQLQSLSDSLQEKEKIYEENKERIDNLETLSSMRSEMLDKTSKLKTSMETLKKDVLELYKTNGSLEQRLKELEDQKNDFHELESQYTASDLFMRCMHPNGISYDIIKRRLPLINDEISKILTNIVEFEIFFENEDNKLDILIKHPKHAPRPIELGSGAEKAIASMAIRLAMLNVSTLPKGDIFVLDEPGTALDAENMDGFIRILDMIKTQFKTVLLISHLDGLKDAVDKQLMIEKVQDRAYINE